MEERFKLNWSEAIKAGVFMSLVFIAFSVIQYVFNLLTIGLYAGMLIGIINLVLTFLSLWLFGNMYKKNAVTGLFSWGNAFSVMFIIALVSSIVLSLYTYVFNTVIDPEYMAKVAEEMKYMMEENFINMGLEEEQYIQHLDNVDKQMGASPISQAVKGMFYGLGLNVFLSLFVAIILRKKNPVFE